jgi:hypothetical protein
MSAAFSLVKKINKCKKSTSKQTQPLEISEAACFALYCAQRSKNKELSEK